MFLTRTSRSFRKFSCGQGKTSDDDDSDGNGNDNDDAKDDSDDDNDDDDDNGNDDDDDGNDDDDGKGNPLIIIIHRTIENEMQRRFHFRIKAAKQLQISFKHFFPENQPIRNMATTSIGSLTTGHLDYWCPIHLFRQLVPCGYSDRLRHALKFDLPNLT